MYIQKVEINNIRSIDHFEMTFPSPAGWHVLIGDNGAGKTSIIRAIAICMLGSDIAKALSFEDFSNWIPPTKNSGIVNITALRDNNYDKPTYNGKKEVQSEITINRKNNNGQVEFIGKVNPKNALWGDYSGSNGWFLAAYGPFRRLRGESSDIFGHIARSKPKLGACITAFRDDAALTLLTQWLKDLALDALKKPKEKAKLEGIIKFINSAHLLPGDAILLNDIDSNGIKLKDGNGVDVSIYEMSDGFRSVLSMTIDIIRFLIDTYGADKVFASGEQKTINLPGVVLIDEVDAHLHPTWQTRIGQWFTQYFPNIQFIVTTHSPLVCRACEKGSIWRLAAPGSDMKSEEITGTDKQKLINGNILDAYGTEIFGKSITISESGNKKRNRLAELNIKSIKGEITESESDELRQLKIIFPTQKIL